MSYTLTNKRNGTRYSLEMAGISSFCNGLSFSVRELAENDPTPRPTSWDTNTRYEQENIREVRSRICELLNHQGFKLADVESGKWLDLITGEASKAFRVFRLDCGRAPAAYAFVRKLNINKDGIQDVVKKYPLKKLASPIYSKENSYTLKSLGTALDVPKDVPKTTLSSQEVLDYMDKAINSPNGESNYLNMKGLLSNPTSQQGKHLMFSCGGQAQPQTQHILNTTHPSPYAFSSVSPYIYANAVKSGYGMRSPSMLLSPTTGVRSKEVWDRWFWSSIYERLVAPLNTTTRPILIMTDNCIDVNAYYNKTGTHILTLANLQAEGVTCVKTWGGNDLHFVVVPMLIGNKNHSMHDTVVCFFSASPLSLTDITKTPKRVKS